jgi:hypothetical protein
MIRVQFPVLMSGILKEERGKVKGDGDQSETELETSL